MKESNNNRVKYNKPPNNNKESDYLRSDEANQASTITTEKPERPRSGFYAHAELKFDHNPSVYHTPHRAEEDVPITEIDHEKTAALAKALNSKSHTQGTRPTRHDTAVEIRDKSVAEIRTEWKERDKAAREQKQKAEQAAFKARKEKAAPEDKKMFAYLNELIAELEPKPNPQSTAVKRISVAPRKNSIKMR